MNKKLGLIITYHNKTIEEINRLFLSLIGYDLNRIEIIFIYREISNEILDLVLEYEVKLSVNIIKIDEGLKNKKIIEATRNTNCDYYQVVDPDDEINPFIMNDFVKNELNTNVDIILNSFIFNGKKNNGNIPRNQSLIFSKKIIGDTFKIRDNIVSQDLHFCGVLFLISKSFKKTNYPFYIYIKDGTNKNNMSNLEFALSNKEISKCEYLNNINDLNELMKLYNHSNKKEKTKKIRSTLKIFKRRLKILSK